MLFKKLLLTSVGVVLVGTTIVETMAGVKAKEAVEVFAGERHLDVRAPSELDGMHSGVQVIEGIIRTPVGEASVSDRGGRNHEAEKNNSGYNSGLIAIQETPPPEDKNKDKGKTKPKPKPKGK